MTKLPNIRGEYYQIGRLAASKVSEENVKLYYRGASIRDCIAIGFTLFRIPRTRWIIWWITN